MSFDDYDWTPAQCRIFGAEASAQIARLRAELEAEQAQVQRMREALDDISREDYLAFGNILCAIRAALDPPESPIAAQVRAHYADATDGEVRDDE